MTTDRKGNVYEILISVTRFTVGSAQTTESSAETPTKNSSQRYTNNTKNYVEYRKLIQKEKTAREKALDDLGKKLASSPGLYSSQEKADTGTIYYLHNKPALKESDIIWKMTAEAWGVSSDGGKTWNGGMTVDGDAITRILTATGVNADWINAGAITVKDEEDEGVLFSIDMKTGRFIVKAENFSLDENGNASVSGKYTASYLRRYDSNTVTEEEAIRARKIVAGFQFDDVTQEELDKYDLTGDGLKLNDALMLARIASGYYDWIEYGTEIEINPLSNAAALKAKVTQQSCVDGVVGEKITIGETKISGAGMKTPSILSETFETIEKVTLGEEEEYIERRGTTGTFTSADGKIIEVVNGIIVLISEM